MFLRVYVYGWICIMAMQHRDSSEDDPQLGRQKISNTDE